MSARLSSETKDKVYDIVIDHLGNETRLVNTFMVDLFPPSRVAAKLNTILPLVKPLIIEYLTAPSGKELSESFWKIKKILKEYND